MGSEKRLPARERGEISTAIRRFLPGQDAVTRFKHQNLVQRLMTLDRYWERTLKAIEQGRYERDVFKADYRQNKEAKPSAKPAPTNKVERHEAGAAAEAFLASLDPSQAVMPSISIRGVSKSNASMPKIEQRGHRTKPSK